MTPGGLLGVLLAVVKLAEATIRWLAARKLLRAVEEVDVRRGYGADFQEPSKPPKLDHEDA